MTWAMQYDASEEATGKLIAVGTREACEAMAAQYEKEFADDQGHTAQPLEFKCRDFTLHAVSTWVAVGHQGEYWLTEWK